MILKGIDFPIIENWQQDGLHGGHYFDLAECRLPQARKRAPSGGIYDEIRETSALFRRDVMSHNAQPDPRTTPTISCLPPLSTPHPPTHPSTPALTPHFTHPPQPPFFCSFFSLSLSLSLVLFQPGFVVWGAEWNLSAFPSGVLLVMFQLNCEAGAKTFEVLDFRMESGAGTFSV